MNTKKSGFTLIELMVVMVILGMLAVLISGNFFNSLKRGRDTRRKTDIQNIQKAFEVYYEDMGRFPPDDILGETKVCYHNGTSYDCDRKVYMQTLPTDPSIGTYVYETDPEGTYYKLYSCIENEKDISSGVLSSGGVQDPNGWVEGCGSGVCTNCKFKVESSNAE